MTKPTTAPTKTVRALSALALLLAFAAAPLTSARCDGETPVAPAAPAAPADPVKALAARCVAPDTPYEVKVAPAVRLNEKVLVEKIEFPSSFTSVDPERNDVVKAKLFRTETPSKVAVVALGGWRFDPLTPRLAARLAEETGFLVLSLDLPFQGERTPKGKAPGQVTFSADLDQNLDTFVQAAQDVERAVRWIVSERGADPKRLGLLGTSLGGYVSADLYGMTDRFSAAVVQIAGGDVASVIFNGNWLTQQIRAALVEKGLDEPTVRERMRPLDPATWARKDRKDGLLLLAAEKDEIVPLGTVRALAEAYGGARLEVMPGVGHISPKGLEDAFPKAIEHLRRVLAPETATAATPAPTDAAPATPTPPAPPAPSGTR